MTGTAESPHVARASGQYSDASSATMTTKVAELTMRNTRPKPTKRRMVEMSDVRTREQLARLPAVVERHRKPLEVRVEVVAHRGLHAERGVGHDAPPGEGGDRFDGAQGQRQPRERPDPVAVVVGDGPVDHGLGDEGYERGRDEADERGGHHRQQLPHVGAYVGPGAPKRDEAHTSPKAVARTVGRGYRRLAAGSIELTAPTRLETCLRSLDRYQLVSHTARYGIPIGIR